MVAGWEKSIYSGESGDSLMTMVSLDLISSMQWVIQAGWIGDWPLTSPSFLL